MFYVQPNIEPAANGTQILNTHVFTDKYQTISKSKCLKTQLEIGLRTQYGMAGGLNVVPKHHPVSNRPVIEKTAGEKIGGRTLLNVRFACACVACAY